MDMSGTIEAAPAQDAVATETGAPAVPERSDALSFYDDAPKGDPAPEPQGEVPEGEEQAGEAEKAPVEPIAPPKSWSNQERDKVAWSELPRQAQEIIAAREVERDSWLFRKSEEAARTRETVEAEARDGLSRVLQHHSQQLQHMAQLVGLPQAPDQSLLNSENPDDHRLYMIQQNRYQNTAAQVAELQRTAETARQQAEHLQSQAQRAAIQADEARLVEKWPQWSEPSERAKLLATLQPIAAELGYGPEVQAQASADDLFALHTALSWKTDAEKYRSLMKQRMEPVRAAKQLPPAMRAAAPTNGARQPVDASAVLYPDDQPRR